ncbi:hypothetical protein QAD02_017429 [Eretmocerus hayati]|uniref:Uncharacterized protein n=1 Tax=Eretmocerus hayati TaxID=131215 RepID=A0ACC2PEB2_9HYME|nr:hypothetical protein QAD02_017429 [Eretmocerus hayati]
MRFFKHILQQLVALGLLSTFAKSDPLYAFPGADVRKVGLGNLYFVALVREENSGKHLCTGSLISKNQVLTSATCVENYELRKLRVFFGSIGRAIVKKHFGVIAKQTYQDWTKQRCDNSISCSWDVQTNDISILRLDVADTSISPAVIDYSYNFKSGDRLKVLGWGPTNDGSRPYTAQRGVLEVMSKEMCEARVRQIILSCFSTFKLPKQVSCATSTPAVLGRERCPTYSKRDFNPDQINLILHLSVFEQFIKETIKS